MGELGGLHNKDTLARGNVRIRLEIQFQNIIGVGAHLNGISMELLA